MIYYKDKAVVLTYHNISDEPFSDITISPDRFRNDIYMLKHSGFNIISLNTMINAINGKEKLPNNAVVITFDDGLKGVYDYAFPVLKNNNIPAVIFVITSRCDDSKKKINGLYFLDEKLLKEMYESGIIDIQSHTHNCHRLFKNKFKIKRGVLCCRIYGNELKRYETRAEYLNRIKKDLSDSKKKIRRITGKNLDVLCFPFGHYNKKIIRAAKEIGFENFVTCNYGYNSSNSKNIMIKRINAGLSYLQSYELKKEILQCTSISKIRIIALKIRSVKRKILYRLYCIYRKKIIKSKRTDLKDSLFDNFAPKCSFIFNFNDKEHYVNSIKKLNIENSIVNDAEKICNHVFNLLGSGDRYLDKQIPWNKDFKTEFIWKNNFFTGIKIIDLSNNADVKVPWEISRFQHVFTLGKAYWISENEKYTEEFRNEIENWIEENPFEMSVNWTCSMEVSIRAVNWIAAYFFFKDSSIINSNFWNKFNKILYLHGIYIIRNLENRDTYKDNHFVANLVGLIWLGIYFGDFIIKDKSKKNNPKYWLDFGIKELNDEMFVEVNRDGTDYEASTSYHRLVTELFLLTTILCTKNKIMFSEKYVTRLEKMCEFIMNITKPNGLSPLIGDADDGRLIIFSNYSCWEKRDFRHILAIAGVYFHRNDFRYHGRNHKEDALWAISWKEEETVPTERLKSEEYIDGGYYILRNDKIYCAVRCGELSCRGQGGHSHNDQLSFELNFDGEDFIIDAGAFVYTADYNMRNFFRSTSMHSTVHIDGYEQNHFNSHQLFAMKEETFAECTEFSNNKFVGKHYGYKYKCGVIHERRIELNEHSISIKDILINMDKGKNIKASCSFILDKDVKISKYKHGYELIKNSKRIFFENADKLEVKIEKCNVCSGYGVIYESNRIVVHNVDTVTYFKFIL